jgi:hypothetical protein
MRVSRQIRQGLELIATERGIDQAEIEAATASGWRLYSPRHCDKKNPLGLNRRAALTIR